MGYHSYNMCMSWIIVEPPNKGYVGDNIINSAVLSFIEGLSSFSGSQCL